MQPIIYFCSFGDAKRNVYEEHLLFAKDGDVVSDGARPFQLVNSQYPGTSAVAKG